MTFFVGPGRPSGGYGPGLLSVSEIAGYVSDPEALCRWAHYVTRQGRNPFVERDRDAQTGDRVHKALIAWLAGDPTAGWHLDDCEDAEGARNAYTAGQAWLAAELRDGWKPESAEVPLVSHHLGLAGTYDLVMSRDVGRGLRDRRLYDIKSRTEQTAGGKRRDSMARSSDLLQLALYAILIDDCTRVVVDDARVVCCPRTGGAAVDTGFSDTEMRDARFAASALLALVKLTRAWERTKVAAPMPRLEDVDAADPRDADFMEGM